MTAAFRPTSLDHVALWVADRAPLASFLCDHLGMHVIEETDAFTLVGVDAKLGKLTLFAAEGPRSPGALERVVLRVKDLDAALDRLPIDPADVQRLPLLDARFERVPDDVDPSGTIAAFDAPGGLRIGLVQAPGPDYDIDHVVLRLPDPESASGELAAMGFERRNGWLAVADRHVRIEPGEADDSDSPLLNHIALLVESARDVQEQAQAQGFEIDDVKDAPNTFAVFLRGPAGVRIEYVEHKPGFALV
jgi:catechol 2,3-dioxygenase-like lactoylglutathione lyase family enzyme